MLYKKNFSCSIDFKHLMKGLGQGPYARVLIFLILSFSIVFLINYDHPTSLRPEPSAVAHQEYGGISWLGWRRGET